MRPVYKGDAPRSASGEEITYLGDDGHQRAKHELHNRILRYCSYCERRGDLHVEHVIPKRKHDEPKHLWVNYLLACQNCNSVKQQKDTLTEEWDCLFPDEVNTAWAFVYGPGAKVDVNSNLATPDRVRAQKTINMVGLDRNPPPDPRDRDLRWQDRDSAWQQAMDSLQDLVDHDTEILRKKTLKEAELTGFFSVWWTIFGMDKDANRRAIMRSELILRFNARATCFESDGSVKQNLAVV